MKTVKCNDVEYIVANLDTFAQLHVARKLGPSLPIVEGLIDPRNAEKDKNMLAVLMLSHINDTDAEFVVRKCLSAVSRRSADGTLAKVQAPNGALMFDDIELHTLLEITVEVIEQNLGDFFRTALGNMAAVEH